MADGVVSAVGKDVVDGPLRALRWAGTGWEEVAATQDGGDYLSTVEPVAYLPVGVWAGDRVYVGASQGLTAYVPAAGRFEMLRDRRLFGYGAPAVWTGRELVVPPNHNSEGFVHVPRPGP